MFRASFPEEVEVSDQDALRAAFKCNEIYLRPGGLIRLSGDVVLGPGVIFSGQCILVGPIDIEGGCALTDVKLGRDTRVRSHSVLSGLAAGERNLFGPFCFVRDGCEVANEVILGAHVEAARSRFASGVKISHRAFVGDVDIGKNTIIGAGVVFCNYDDGQRRVAKIGADVVVGSGSMLVAPLNIGDQAVIGAGSVVTKSIAAYSRLIQKR